MSPGPAQPRSCEPRQVRKEAAVSGRRVCRREARANELFIFGEARKFHLRQGMSYQVLARKWRPQVFEDVVGQEHVTRTLQNAISANRLAHAFLFSGPRGGGRTAPRRLPAARATPAARPRPAPRWTLSR